MTKEERIVYNSASRIWGREAQIDMIVEECAELIQAIQKLKRKSDSPKVLDHLHEEIADVIIMIEQAQVIFEENEINRHKTEKFERLKQRLANN